MEEKRKPSFYVGKVIYVRNDNDLIKQLINGERGKYSSSHQRIYGTPIKTTFVDLSVKPLTRQTSMASKIDTSPKNLQVLTVPIRINNTGINITDCSNTSGTIELGYSKTSTPANIAYRPLTKKSLESMTVSQSRASLTKESPHSGSVKMYD